jgi:hypothetical protein
VYYVANTHGENAMEILKNIAVRDWAIAIGAFIAGAWIF